MEIGLSIVIAALCAAPARGAPRAAAAAAEARVAVPLNPVLMDMAYPLTTGSGLAALSFPSPEALTQALDGPLTRLEGLKDAELKQEARRALGSERSPEEADSAPVLIDDAFVAVHLIRQYREDPEFRERIASHMRGSPDGARVAASVESLGKRLDPSGRRGLGSVIGALFDGARRLVWSGSAPDAPAVAAAPDSAPSADAKALRAVVRAAEDPLNERGPRLESMRGILARHNQGAFSPSEFGSAAERLTDLFASPMEVVVDPGALRPLVALNEHDGHEHVFPMNWTNALGEGAEAPGGEAEGFRKKIAVHRAFREWARENRFERNGRGPVAAALERFEEEVSSRYPYLRLSRYRGFASGERIDAVRVLLGLLPARMLASEQTRHALRRGIELNGPGGYGAPFGEYIPWMGMMSTVDAPLGVRDFIELFLHEFGHTQQGGHLENGYYRQLGRMARQDPYALPALGQSGENRNFYVFDNLLDDPSEQKEPFAEHFMHYILHGELFARGWEGVMLDGAPLVRVNSLWRLIYRYYRDHIFHGVEFRVLDGALMRLDAGAAG